MRRIFTILIFFALLSAGCSNDDDTSNNNENPVTNTPYFKMKIGGVDLPFEVDRHFNFFNSAYLRRAGDIFTLSGQYSLVERGIGKFEIMFDKLGNIKSATLGGQDPYYDISISYNNYKYFPEHYFDLDIISLDEATGKIKLSFSGIFYLDNKNQDSERLEASGEGLFLYDLGDEELYSGLKYGDFEIFCSANIGQMPWNANNREAITNGAPAIFTNYDPYKIEMFFAPNNNPTATYNVTPSDTENYIRFSKFNTATLQYDEYNVNGQLAYHYKEWHGATDYTYFGTFNFTATNQNNPADIIQVTDGKYITYLIH